MRASAAGALLAIGLVLSAAASGEAWDRGRHRGHGVRTRFFIGVGPAFWWGWPYPYWRHHVYHVYPPPVIAQEPLVYIQAPPAPPAPPPSYWYYCTSAQAYYPSVQACPEAWIRVPPRTE